MTGNFYARYNGGTSGGGGGGGGTTTRVVELRVLTGPEVAAGQITLSATPQTANYTVLEIAGAPSQYYGDDFIVSGNVLSWTGLGLDGILAAGDKLTIIHN